MSTDNSGRQDAVFPARRRPTIALFIPNFRMGGAERQAFELAKHLDRHKYEVMVIALRGDGELAVNFNSLNDLKVVVLDGGNPFQTIFRLAMLVRRAHIRVLHSFLTAPNAYSLLAKIFSGEVTLILGMRMALSDPSFGYSSRFSRIRERGLDAFIRGFSFLADFAISNSEAGHRLNGKKFAGPNAIIPNGIDAERFKPNPASRKFLCQLAGVDSGAKFVGILANCTSYKDYPSFVRAARIVADQCRDVQFVSIGDDRTVLAESVRGLVEDLGLDTIFHFLGVRTDVEKLLPGLEVLCSSSVTEAFSNAICEGMACGVPCVVTDVGDSRRIAGDTGIVVPPRNPEALAAGVVSLLDMNPAERERLAVAARQRILENFDVAGMARRHEHLYESVLSKASLYAGEGQLETPST